MSVAVVVAAAASAGAFGGSPAAADSLGPVQWGFTGLGAPSASKAGITSSWFRGNGTWNGGAAQGTIRADDSGGGAPKTRIALKVSGSSALSPQITKYGYKGVGLVPRRDRGEHRRQALPEGDEGHDHAVRELLLGPRRPHPPTSRPPAPITI